MRPLYDAASREPRQLPEGGHAGLWFDKFCWSETDKLKWIQTVAGKVGDRDRLREHAQRQARMVKRLGGRIFVFESESRFATGLGRSHPVENGFAWHPTLGTPWLPGSSVKGMLLAWARSEGASDEARDRLFGKQDQSGAVCFLDAVPDKPVVLEADVMTPHYGGWTPEDPPGDWRSPVPIPFLVTASGTRFLFGFTPRRPLADSDLDCVSAWLCAALEWAGGGAKTAVGYGRFRHNEGATGRMEKELDQAAEEEEAGKTSEGRWRLELKGKSEAEVLEMVRVHLEKGMLTDPAERQAFAKAVDPDWVVAWNRGRPVDPATKVGGKKLKQRARLLRAETG